ncbi:hypothetical protein ATANTOWER_026158 [Ataeniobius toweri]|uniref:Uncharacterized protein n=1 Tax=Ataeniobius toweri TaxID=208326 RepID=A0ABU7BJD7_9TELE|nr:hypothetical protein [Ataeniobius toweri]
MTFPSKRHTKYSPACLLDGISCIQSSSTSLPRRSCLPLLCLCPLHFPHQGGHSTHHHPVLFGNAFTYLCHAVTEFFQITKDVIHLCAPTSALVCHPVLLL